MKSIESDPIDLFELYTICLYISYRDNEYE